MYRMRISILGLLFAIVIPWIGIHANEEEKIYLLRAPRSGSHWFFYCVNTLFNKAVYTEAIPRPYRGDYYTNRGGGEIITAHNPYDLHLEKNSYYQDRLILLIRNYRECMLRDYIDPEAVKREISAQAAFNHLSSDKGWVLNLRMNHYFHNLRVYDLWNPEKRLLIYYEDFLQNPRETLLQLSTFMGEENNNNLIDAFIADIDRHMEESISIYEDPKKGYISHTRGRDFSYHTNRVGKKEAYEIDRLVIKHFPHFVEEYLSRYLFESEE